MKISASVLGTLLAYSAAIEDKAVDEVKDNILNGHFEAALKAHRKYGGYLTTDYVLCAIIERNYKEALQCGKRLPGWKPIWKTYPGRMEGQDFIDLPCLPPVPKGFQISAHPGYKDLLQIQYPDGTTWTFGSNLNAAP